MISSAPAIARSDGGTVIAAEGPTHGLNFYWNDDGDPTWNHYVIGGLGAQTTYAAPAMNRGANNTTIIAVQGPDHRLDFYWNTDGDPTWHPSNIAGPGTAYSAPGIWRTNHGSTVVAVQGPNHSLRAFWNNDGDPTWHPFSEVNEDVGPVHSAPSINGKWLGSTGNKYHHEGNYEILVMAFVGAKDSLKFCSGFADQALGYDIYSQPLQGAAAYATPAIVYNTGGGDWGLVQLAAQGADNSLDFYWSPFPQQEPWTVNLVAGPQSTFSAPAMARTNGGTVIAARGPDNFVNFYWNNDGDPTWHPSLIPGAVAASAPALARGDDSTIIAARGPGPVNLLCIVWNNDGDPNWSPPLLLEIL